MAKTVILSGGPVGSTETIGGTRLHVAFTGLGTQHNNTTPSRRASGREGGLGREEKAKTEKSLLRKEKPTQPWALLLLWPTSSYSVLEEIRGQEKGTAKS